MSLNPVQKWKDTATAGSAEPVLLFEIKPTIQYQEANFFGDWEEGQSSANLNINPASNAEIAKRDFLTLGATDELRLMGAEVVAPEKQLNQGSTQFPFGCYTMVETKGFRDLERPYQYAQGAIQIFRAEKAFRLKRLCIGLYNSKNPDTDSAGYTGNSIISLYVNIDNPKKYEHPFTRGASRERTAAPRSSINIFIDPDLKPVISKTIDHLKDALSPEDGGPVEGTDYEVDSKGGFWRILDLSDENIWIPANTTCALRISVDSWENVNYLELRGSDTHTCGHCGKRYREASNCPSCGSFKFTFDYTGGNLYRYQPYLDMFEMLDAVMAFKFYTYGYTSETGTAIWTFTQDRDPRPGERGELELRYCPPKGTSIKFFTRETGIAQKTKVQAYLGEIPWRQVSDGIRITQRTTQVKVEMKADSDCLDTPRLYSIRVAWKRTDKFLLASQSLFGYPNCVAEAPDFSAEGDPLSGSAQSTDQSMIKFLDPGGMISNMFKTFPLKNDRIKVSLGFNTSTFTEADFLPFKTVWIESWQPGDGIVTFKCYDQHVKFRELKIPTTGDPPEQTEQIHYSSMSPAAILRDLLMRARMRPSEIDYAPDGNGNPLAGTSFGSLHTKCNWSFDYIIEKPKSPQDIANELCQHLLGFLTINEQGKWAVGFVDFDASPNADTEALGGNDIVVDSETYDPGLEHLKNYVVVFYGGRK